MSNYSILQQNLLNLFKTDLGQLAFLWASERKDADRYLYKAEAYAYEVEHLVEQLNKMIPSAMKPHGGVQEIEMDLLKFILKRHCVYKFPDQQTTWLDR